MMSTRVEKHLIRPSSPYFAMLFEFCHFAKNLYNHANYIVRDKFIHEHEIVGYAKLDKILKADKEYPDYRAMPLAQSAQQVLRLLDKNWKGYFVAAKDYKENPGKYLGRPKLPKYKKKDGLFILTLTNQNCRIREGVIQFPQKFKGFTVRPKFIEKPFKSFQQIRFVPTGTDIMLEIVYETSDVEPKPDNGKYAGIDIGIDNLLTVATNTGQVPFIINGRIPKSINQFYNKKVAHLKSICQTENGQYSSNKIRQFTAKRNRKIEYYIHKASRRLVDECLFRGVSTIVIGKNDGWKQESCLSKRVNQHFVQIPFAKLIEMIKYKAEDKGITVLLTEESYTSGTSFLDNELPTKENYDKKRRIHRGLFRTADGKTINADVNGAFQIIRKVFPKVTADGIEGVVLCPLLWQV